MGARPVAEAHDPIGPRAVTNITITCDGQTIVGVLGQTLAGVMLANDVAAWRATSFTNRPRGAFCGIGVCFDCLVIVNGQRDVRACQRRARAGDVVEFHRDAPLARREERP